MMDFIFKFLKFGVVGILGMAVDFLITWLCKEKLLQCPEPGDDQ